MSRASLWVRFPDGTIRHGIYDGTIDTVWPPLWGTSDEAWAAWKSGDYDCGDDYEQGTGDPVDIATNYGHGFWWTATATKTRVTSLHGDDERYDAGGEHRGLPEWVN